MVSARVWLPEPLPGETAMRARPTSVRPGYCRRFRQVSADPPLNSLALDWARVAASPVVCSLPPVSPGPGRAALVFAEAEVVPRGIAAVPALEQTAGLANSELKPPWQIKGPRQTGP